MPKTFTCSNGCDQDNLYYNYIEICIDPRLMNNFAIEDGMNTFLNNCMSSDDFQKLRSDLLKEILEIINKCLTKKQKEVMKKTFIEGKTQHQISGELGKHQTTIHKILQGNIDYNNNKKRYGGAIKKIRRLCSESERIKNILEKMHEFNDLQEQEIEDY